MKTPIALIAAAGVLAVAVAAPPARAPQSDAARKLQNQSAVAAVHAVIAEENAAFLALHEERLAATWLHEPSALKIVACASKEVRLEGWDAIRAYDRKYLAEERALPAALHCCIQLSNFRIIVRDDTAWATCDARWEGYEFGECAMATQSRLYVLNQTNGRWKIALMAVHELTFERAALCD